MKTAIHAIACLLLAGSLIFISGGCGEIGQESAINEEQNQYSRVVESIPAFNGASCLVCIDVHGIGGAENLKWALKAGKNPSVPQWTPAATEAAILKEINDKISKCPADSKVKLQFMYHFDSKKQYQRDGGIIKQNYEWLQYRSVETVLQELAKNDKSRITKVYLTCCSSHERPSTVNRAFQIKSVTNVVTVDNTILLGCGSIAGATYPTFRPMPVNIIVWKKEGNKQIAQTPKQKMPADKKFDIKTNTVMNR